MIKILRVRGDSLAPEIQHGDYVVGMSVALSSVSAGDIVVFEHPMYGRLIKKIRSVGPGAETVEVAGIHPLSVDSRRFGAIPITSLTHKVIWHLPR